MQNKLSNLIEYGLYLLVFMLPIQTRWVIKAGELNGGYWEYGTISLYAADVLLILVIGLFAFTKFSIFNFQINSKFKIQNSKFNIGTIWWLIAILELFVFISIFVASDKLVATYGYVRFLLGIGLFWLIISASYDRLKLVYAFLVGAFLQASLGIWQFLSQSSFANKWLGMALHDPSAPGTSVVETLSGERWLRAYGGIDHPNMLGGLLIVGMLFCVGLIVGSNFRFPTLPTVCLSGRQGRQVSNFQINSKFKVQNSKIFILYFLFFIFTISLFFTFSRGAWAGLLVGLLVVLALSFISRELSKMKLFSIIIFLCIVSSILIWQYSELVLTRLSKDTRLEIKSSEERLASYVYSFSLLQEHRWFGVGVNNYTLAMAQELSPGQPSWFYQPVHNAWLLIWTEIGIIGLISFISLLCVMCYALCVMQRGRKSFDHILSFSILATLSVMMLFDHYLWSLHFGTMFWWLNVGLSLKHEEKTS